MTRKLRKQKMIRKFEKTPGQNTGKSVRVGETQEKKNLGPYFAFVSTGSKKPRQGRQRRTPPGQKVKIQEIRIQRIALGAGSFSAGSGSTRPECCQRPKQCSTSGRWWQRGTRRCRRGGAQAAVERHGKGTGGGCTNGAAGDNVQRVRGCIGDSALSNKAEAHYIVDHTVAALVRGPLFGEEGGG